MTSDALPHGKCRRDASACEGETNCTLHFPPIANCTAGVTGLDSFVFLGAYQPLYYAGDLDAPLRYNPSSGAPLCADKSSQAHTTVQYVPDTGPARTEHTSRSMRAAPTPRALCVDMPSSHVRAVGASRCD